MAIGSPGVSQAKNLTPRSRYFWSSAVQAPPLQCSKLLPIHPLARLWAPEPSEAACAVACGEWVWKSQPEPWAGRSGHATSDLGSIWVAIGGDIRMGGGDGTECGSHSPCIRGQQALSPQLLFLHKVQAFTWLLSKADSAQYPHAWLKIAALQRGLWQGGAV